MEISNSQKINSSIVKISDIEDLVDRVDELAQKNNKEEKFYKNDPKFEISRKDGFDISFKNKGEFIKYIKSNPDEIKSFKISFWGRDKFVVYFGDRYSNFSIKTENEGKNLEYIKYINKIFKEKSWNNVFNYGWMQVPISIFIALFSISIIAFFKKEVLLNGNIFLITIILYLPANLISIPLDRYASNLYTNLVLRDDSNIYGRSFKKDLQKIIIVIFIVVIIPILVNLMTK
ncbi:MAG: hypothetical protein WCZ08_00170 [Parcubacteria group bacterium]|jgi:hypothetical protein|nr:hypothetical protein [Candidatus Moranbacteria bacterium]